MRCCQVLRLQTKTSDKWTSCCIFLIKCIFFFALSTSLNLPLATPRGRRMMRIAGAKLLFTQQIPALGHQDTFLAAEWPPLLRPHTSGRYHHNFEIAPFACNPNPLNASCCFNCVGRLRNEEEVRQVAQVQPIGGDHYQTADPPETRLYSGRQNGHPSAPLNDSDGRRTRLRTSGGSVSLEMHILPNRRPASKSPTSLPLDWLGGEILEGDHRVFTGPLYFITINEVIIWSSVKLCKRSEINSLSGDKRWALELWPVNDLYAVVVNQGHILSYCHLAIFGRIQIHLFLKLPGRSSIC